MNDPRAVLFVTPRWARDGGVGAHVQASARELAQRGIDVHVLVAKIADRDAADAVGEFAGGDVTVHCSPDLFNTGLPVARRLGEALAVAPDVVHLHQLDDPDLLRALRQSAPVVVSAHAYTACTSGFHYFRPGQECSRGHGPGCLLHLGAPGGCAHTRYPQTLPVKYRNATRGLRTLAGADLAVSYSTAVDRHLGDNGIQRRQIVPYFTTVPAAQPPAAQSASVPPGAGGRRIIYAGRVVASKGVDVLLKALPHFDGEVRICGDGRQLPAMRSLAQRLGVSARVHFAGWLGPEALAGELEAADVAVVPSVWPEPFGIVGIEALAAGRPVVATAAGGILDWMTDGKTGLLVKPGDPLGLAEALQALLDDPARRERMGQAGRAVVAERFSADQHVAALMGAYRRAGETWAAGS